MDRWVHAPLVRGQLSLDADELPVNIESQVRLYNGDDRTPFDGGTLTLTPKRIFWVDGVDSSRAIMLPLQYIQSISVLDGVNLRVHKSSPKIVVQLHTIQEDERSARPTAQWVRLSSSFSSCKLSFRGHSGAKSMATFFQDLRNALNDGKWKSAAPVAVGIAGIVRSKKAELKESESSIREAFKGDLDALMTKAKDMVKLAEKFAAKVSEDPNAKDDQSQLQTYILGLGIPNPVTRQSTSNQSSTSFHRDLARELAQFLPQPLAKAKGMMLLQDVYCLYNRARGTELISPADLVNAATLFEELNMPMSLRSFSSGVKVIQDKNFSDKAMAEKILELAETHKYITVSLLAQVEDMSTTLANECLLTSESQGVLCRDDTVESLSFYPNIF